MRPLDLALLLASLAGILGLAQAAELLAPPPVALRDLPAWEGRSVAVEAIVLRARPAGSGAQALTLADGSGTAAAFWGGAEPLEGARVRAEGAVERDRGRWQLRVRAVEVLAPAAEPLGVAAAARLAPFLQGRAAVVAGSLEWPEDGEPHLAEGGARLLLEAAHRDALAAWAGARVVAEGTVRYEPSRAAYYLEAWEVRPA